MKRFGLDLIIEHRIDEYPHLFELLLLRAVGAEQHGDVEQRLDANLLLSFKPDPLEVYRHGFSLLIVAEAGSDLPWSK